MVDINYIISHYLVYIGLIGLVAYILYDLIVTKKSIKKPISREEEERKKFIERMKPNLNQSYYKWLYRGKDKIGLISHERSYILKGNPISHEIHEFVVKPCLFWKIKNPFAKEQAFQINFGELDKENNFSKPNVIIDNDKLILHSWISFEYYFGIFYDNTLQREHTDIILKKDIALTDLHSLASVYFVKGQELSTIGYMPYSHDLALEEKRKQTEIEKKRGTQQTV